MNQEQGLKRRNPKAFDLPSTGSPTGSWRKSIVPMADVEKDEQQLTDTQQQLTDQQRKLQEKQQQLVSKYDELTEELVQEKSRNAKMQIARLSLLLVEGNLVRSAALLNTPLLKNIQSIVMKKSLIASSNLNLWRISCNKLVKTVRRTCCCC